MAAPDDILRSPDPVNSAGQELSPQTRWRVAGGLEFEESNGEIVLTGAAPGYGLRARAVAALALPANTRTGNVLTANANGALPAQDGVTPLGGDSILVTSEATLANNGLYRVTTVGDGSTPWVLTRHEDFDASAKVRSGALFTVAEGTTYAGSLWLLTSADPITLNTSAIRIRLIGIAMSADGSVTFPGELSVQNDTSFTRSDAFTTTEATPELRTLDIDIEAANFVGTYEVTIWLSGVVSGVGICRFKRSAVYQLDDDGSMTERVADETIGTDYDGITVGGVSLASDGGAPATLEVTVTGKAATTITWSLKVAVDKHVVAA